MTIEEQLFNNIDERLHSYSSFDYSLFETIHDEECEALRELIEYKGLSFDKFHEITLGIYTDVLEDKGANI